MPSIGFGEILIILVLALVIFGPKRLPEMGRTIGKSLREFRRATSDLRSEFEADIDESPRASVEERARRLEGSERKAPAAPPPGEAPPT